MMESTIKFPKINNMPLKEVVFILPIRLRFFLHNQTDIKLIKVEKVVARLFNNLTEFHQ